MKISIVTSAFNAEKYIEETIESVLSQRGDFEIEYILVDAKSSDSTFDKINKYKKLVDDGFYEGRNSGITMQVISEPDNGMYEGISKGLKLVTGDIVAYINSDDFYLPNAFSCACEIFKKFPQVKWLTGRESSFNSKGHLWDSFLPMQYNREYIRKGFYGGQGLRVIQQESTFWKRELMTDFDFDKFSALKLAGDFYLWYSFSKGNDLYVVNSSLAGFRYSDGQKSEDKDAYHNELMSIVDNYKPTFKEKLTISSLKRASRIKDKYKLKRNPQIIRFDLGSHFWKFGN